MPKTVYIKAIALGGADIDAICRDATNAANAMRAGVSFDVNGIGLMAWPNTKPDELARRYWDHTRRRAERQRKRGEA